MTFLLAWLAASVWTAGLWSIVRGWQKALDSGEHTQ